MAADLPLLKCDRCGARLYETVNLVKPGDQCDRALVPAEFIEGRLYRLCPGILKPHKVRAKR